LHRSVQISFLQSITDSQEKIYRMRHRRRRYRIASVTARAIALLLGGHDSLLAYTGSPGDSVVIPDLVDPSLRVDPGSVSTGRWVVDQETGRRGSGGPCAPGRLVVVSRRDRRGRYDGG